jgi:3-dehydroquinate synthase class II
MFEFRKYEVATVKEMGQADMVKVLLDDKDAHYLISNTSLGFIPKQGSSAVSEYILVDENTAKYLSELKERDKVLVKRDDEIFFSTVKRLENIRNSKSIMLSVETGRNFYEFIHHFPQKYSTFSLENDTIDGRIIDRLKVGDTIECFEDIEQGPTHFGRKFGEEFLIEV